MPDLFRTKAQALAQVRKNKSYNKSRHGGIPANTAPTGSWITRGYSLGNPGATEPSGLIGVSIPAQGYYLTCRMVTELMADAKSVKVLCNNYSASRNRQIVSTRVVALGSFAQSEMDAAFIGHPTQATWDGGSVSTTIPFRVNAAQKLHPSLKLSDATPFTSIPRTDGGTLPLIGIEEVAFYPGTNTAPVADQGVAFIGRDAVPGTKWVTDPGRTKGAIVQGDMRGLALGKNIDDTSYFCISGVQYQVAGKGATLLGMGSSRMASQFGIATNPAPSTDGTLGPNDKQWAGWFDKAVRAVSTPTKPIEFINMGVPGQAIAKNVLATELFPILNPTHVFVEFDNINNLSQGNVSETNVLLAGTQSIFASAKAAIPTVKLGGWESFTKNLSNTPTNILLPYFTGPNDLNVRSYCAVASALCDYVINTRDLMGDTATPQVLQMIGNGFPNSLTYDGIHQSRDGDLLKLTPAATAVVQQIQTDFFV